MIKKTIVNSVKKKVVELGTQYFKEKLENSKDEFIKYIEKTIEQKIKKEVRKIIYNTLSIILFFTGLIFLIYGAITIIVYLTNLPNFFTPLIFGLVLMISSLIVYLNK